VQFFNGPTLIGTAFNAPYQFTWNNPTFGSHSLTAVLTYDGSHTVTSAPVSITVEQVSAATQSWANLVVSNGGAMPSDNTLCAVDAWYNGMVSAGLDAKMYWSCLCVPDDFIAQRTPFHRSLGVTLLTNSMIFGHANGLALDGTSFVRTGVDPSSVFTATSMGLTAYCGGGSGLGAEGTVPDPQWGGGGGGRYGYIYSNTVSGFALFQVTVAYPFTNPSMGFISLNKTGTNALAYYGANSAHAFQTLGSSAAAGGSPPSAGHQICFADGSTAGFPYGYTSQNNISFLGIHQGLTAGEAETLFNLIQTLRTALGGGYS
jgi:hypothetical protein